jgi:hypothetical protein
MQRIAYEMWYKTLVGTDKLYIVEQFDLKTIEDDVSPEYRMACKHVSSDDGKPIVESSNHRSN